MNNEIVTSLWAEKNVMGNSTSSNKGLRLKKTKNKNKKKLYVSKLLFFSARLIQQNSSF